MLTLLKEEDNSILFPEIAFWTEENNIMLCHHRPTVSFNFIFLQKFSFLFPV